MYTSHNYKTKKALKEAVKAGIQVSVYQPGPFGGGIDTRGTTSVTLEGPHYPQPHRWYAQAKLVDGIIVSVK